jgi:Flp pilus assembly protein TadB
MAQTKRKRRSKHRGTAAGTIEARGRTSRPPSKDERKKVDRAQAREERLNRRPTWNSSLKRAGLAAVVMFVFLLLTTKGKNSVQTAVLFAVFALAIYVPAGYYLELWIWRRRQRRKALNK